jgi:hypothetical protein
MARWVESSAASAERFVRASTGDALHYGFGAFGVAMAFFGALSADLWFVALVSLVISDFLAVVALLR